MDDLVKLVESSPWGFDELRDMNGKSLLMHAASVAKLDTLKAIAERT